MHFTMGVLDSVHGQLGHSIPPKPNVYLKSPPSSGRKAMNAAVTIAIWRVDSYTGQVSNKSISSNVIQVSNGSVIVQLPDADDNNQDKWGIGGTRLGLSDLGNIYEIPVDMGGEVLESDVAYTRHIASATWLNGSTTLDAATGTGHFSSADIGRVVSFNIDGRSSWIVSVNTADEAILNDPNPGADLTASAMDVVAAVDGVTRGVEVSWSDDDFLGQDLAPTDAFPPPAGGFAGAFLDVVVMEDTNGELLYGVPNYLGSFPRSRRIITNDISTVWLAETEGSAWRIGKQTIGQINYVGGDTPIDYQVKVQGHGCLYPANACFGHDGNILIFSGQPLRILQGESLDISFYLSIESEFDGWINQTADLPVVPAYDPIGHFELWCYGRTVIPFHPSTNRWCSPVDITPYVPTGSVIVGQVIINQILYLAVDDGTTIKHYQWDKGTGSTMTLVSTNLSVNAETANIYEYVPTIKVDNDLTTTYSFYLIKDDNLASPLLVGSYTPTALPNLQIPRVYRPNIRGCNQLGVMVVVTDADPRLEIKRIILNGEYIGVKQ